MKHQSPQLGFNNNVRHRGRVFHIQTEDSGIARPHVITHLFVEGGRILKSTKTSYAEFLGVDELTKKVRSLMQEQHKAMFIALRAGKFDQLLGDAPPDSAPAPSTATSSASGATAAPPTNGASPPAASIGDSAEVAPARGRAPMTSLVGATEFARADAVDPVTVAQGGTAPSPAVATVPPSSRPKVHDAVAHADTIALKAVAIPGTGSAATNARLAPPPPRQGEAAAQTPSSLSPLRALGARPSPPHAYPSTTASSSSSPASGSEVAKTDAGRTPASGQVPMPNNIAAQGMARLERPGTRSPSVPPSSSAGVPPTRPPLSASLDLDLEALERAAEQSQTPVYQQIRDLPPPPASLLKPSAPRNTSYRSVTPQATQIVNDSKAGGSPPPAPPSNPTTPSHGPAPTIPRAPTSNRGAQRYAPSRPASIFGSSRPQEGSSIFGEDLISEKSLDEVILSYLAEDLEGPGGPPKK